MRESGVLMHITSLPGPYGIGTMGKQAFSFLDFLQEAGQHNWQILPLTPTGFGDSPYQSCSTYAGNHYLIDLPVLVEEGLLKYEEIDALDWGENRERVDFGLQYRNRLAVLRLAFSRFQQDACFHSFCRDNEGWLPDFALYMALKEKNGGIPWYEWDDGVKLRQPEAIAAAEEELKDQICFFCFVQFQFFKQWSALREYAHGKDVRIIGDVPIYVPYDSVDVWSNPKLFQLNEDMTPTSVAGCPPDAFSEDGQLWGNPLYRWEEMQAEDYRWWIDRLAAAGKLYDVVRLDHFRGFEAYWSVPFGDETARNGQWQKGPGLDFVNAVKKSLPHISIIAEDLGFLTQEVLDLRDESGFPGMKVLEFAFDSREPSAYLPHRYSENSVCYIGTHDNMTMRQWLETAPKDAVAYATEYMALNAQEGMVWGTIRTAMSSVSKLCIIQMQDLLNLGAEGRMNFPGTLSGDNWTWRVTDDYAEGNLPQRLYNVTKLYGRV
ncbi:MAG: 4-alpha-glucanotransferase [Ruminococcaceae bacterium]|nr:4-alpha-glucanotransferase [Oscillospiraceae bacterium]